MPARTLFFIFGLLIVLFSVFTPKVHAAPPEYITVPGGAYIDSGAVLDEDETVPHSPPIEAINPEPPQLADETFADYGIALPNDPRYTTQEEIEQAEADRDIISYGGSIPLGYSGGTQIPLGYSGDLDIPETELDVLVEIRDMLSLFYALLAIGLSAMVVRFILRFGLFNMTKYFGF